jgi:hypothetical protein
VQQQRFGLLRLGQQHIERRDLIVPLDQGCHRANALERLSV